MRPLGEPWRIVSDARGNFPSRENAASMRRGPLLRKLGNGQALTFRTPTPGPIHSPAKPAGPNGSRRAGIPSHTAGFVAVRQSGVRKNSPRSAFGDGVSDLATNGHFGLATHMRVGLFH